MQPASETTTPGRGNLIPWRPGQSGNPKGRPKGSRHKLCEDFIRDLQELWEAHGSDILFAAAKKNPVDIVKVIALLAPKDVKVELGASEAFLQFMRERVSPPAGSSRA
jgi:hypothetical protein